MERKLNKRPKSITRALEFGQVIRWDKRLNYDYKEIYEIYVKYFTPFHYGNGWSVSGEWFDCSERYFNSYVRKHPNFRA